METIFSEHVSNSQEVKTDPFKPETMFKWPIPTKKKEVEVFLGCANYYYRFIVNYSTKERTLIDWTKDIPFICGHTQ